MFRRMIDMSKGIDARPNIIIQLAINTINNS